MNWMHGHRRLMIFAFLVVAQAAFVIGVVVREEARQQGLEIVLQSRPIDPRDPLRGDYVILSYVAEDLSAIPATDVREGQTVYVEFHDEGRYWEPAFVYDYLMPRSEWRNGQVFVKARVERLSPLQVSYANLGEYFIPQGAGTPPEPPDVVVSVSDNGTVRIKRLEINGMVWPDEFDPQDQTPAQPRQLATGTPPPAGTAQ